MDGATSRITILERQMLVAESAYRSMVLAADGYRMFVLSVQNELGRAAEELKRQKDRTNKSTPAVHAATTPSGKTSGLVAMPT